MARARASASKPRGGKYTGRGRLIRDVISALIVLRRGRWTMVELAAELSMGWRSAYRIVAALRACGITVERTTEGVIAYFQVPPDDLRKVLRL